MHYLSQAYSSPFALKSLSYFVSNIFCHLFLALGSPGAENEALTGYTLTALKVSETKRCQICTGL